MAFLGALDEIEKKYYFNHKEKWDLELLVTDAEYRRRGAATSLIRWGTDRADEEGICCRVEASPMGKPVYASCGFEELGTWDVQVEGEPEILPLYCMFRKALTQKGEGPKPVSSLI
jgi:GNAT superfamily N-acetyltransferase